MAPSPALAPQGLTSVGVGYGERIALLFRSTKTLSAVPVNAP